MANNVGKISSLFTNHDGPGDKMLYALPCNYDSLIYVTVFMYLHKTNLCSLGFCNNTLSGKAWPYGICAASYIYLIASGIFSSQFTWWPSELGSPPKGVLYILYKVWVGILLHNFVEQILWYAICEVTSWYLKGFAFSLEWATQKLNFHYFCFDWLRKGSAYEIILTTVALYILYRVLNRHEFLTALKIYFINVSKPSSSRNNSASSHNLLASRIELSSGIAKSCPQNKTKPRDCAIYDSDNQSNQRVRRPHPRNNRVESSSSLCHQNLCNPFNNLGYRIHSSCYHSDVIPSHPYEDNSNRSNMYQFCSCGNCCQLNNVTCALDCGSDDSSILGDAHYWEDGNSQNFQNFKDLDQCITEHSLCRSDSFGETSNSRTYQQNKSQPEDAVVYHTFHNNMSEDIGRTSKAVDKIGCCFQEEFDKATNSDLYVNNLNSKYLLNAQLYPEHLDLPCSSSVECLSEHTILHKQPHLSSKHYTFLPNLTVNQPYKESSSFNQYNPKLHCSSFTRKKRDHNKNEAAKCAVSSNYYSSNRDGSQNFTYIQKPSKQLSKKLYSLDIAHTKKQKQKKYKHQVKTNYQNIKNNKQCQNNNSESEG